MGLVDLGWEVKGFCGSGAAVCGVWLPVRAVGVLPLGAVARSWATCRITAYSFATAFVLPFSASRRRYPGILGYTVSEAGRLVGRRMSDWRKATFIVGLAFLAGGAYVYFGFWAWPKNWDLVTVVALGNPKPLFAVGVSLIAIALKRHEGQ